MSPDSISERKHNNKERNMNKHETWKETWKRYMNKHETWIDTWKMKHENKETWKEYRETFKKNY